jgi:hypothetical protein
MSSQQVVVADMVKMLQAANQRSISKTELYHRVDKLFRQAGKVDQVLHKGLTQAYVTRAHNATDDPHSSHATLDQPDSR